MIKQVSMAICFASALTLSAHASDKQKVEERIQQANEVLHELMATPDKGIPDEIAAKATCVAVVPGFKKGAFVVGGQYGQGVVTCRTAHGWSAPAFIQLTGASFGFQIGGQSTDLVLVGMSRDSAQNLLHDKLKLGGNVSVAAGPVGRESQASTTETANAGFLSYSRNKGLFAGIDLSGDVVNQNHEDTDAYYGRNVTFDSILNGHVTAPADARTFEHTVAQLFHADSHDHAGQ